MKYEIRELGVSAILDQSIKLLQDNFKVLFGIVMILLVPFSLIQGFVTLAIMPAPPVNMTPETQAAYMRSLLPVIGVVYLMLFVLAFIIIPVTNAALVHAISRAYLHQPTSIGHALQFSTKRILPLIWTWFILGLAIMGGLLLCVVPGIIAMLWFALATQVVVLEGRSGFDALKRSRELMKGNMGKLFGLGFVVFLINAAVAAGAAFVPQPHVQTILTAFAQGLNTLLSSATAVVFYFSTRCQHENFDLTLLAESVAASESPVATEPGLM